MKKGALEIVVFFAGACTMTVELVGSRLFAPYLGTSIYVWTSLIGVILATLSLGYWLGGRMADRRPDAAGFSAVLLAASIFIGLAGLAGDPVLAFLQGRGDLRMVSLLAAMLLFGLPSLFLGMVSPYAVRLKIPSVDRSGSTAGGLYALSTAGSILGTFLTGFYLIAAFANAQILFGVAAVLVLSSFFIRMTAPAAKSFLLVLFLLGALANDAFAAWLRGPNFVDVNTAYNRIWIYQTISPTTGHPVREMQINDETSSTMDLVSDDLDDNYTRFYRLGRHFRPEIRRALMIGGAAYSYPKDFLKKNPEASMDVVEIDPGITALAKRYFRLKDDPRLRVTHEDARTFLNRNRKKYDVIYSDAFKSFSIPFQLTTVEAVERMSDALEDGGVVLVNLIGSIEGDTGKFVRAETATFEKIFPQVYLFPVSDPDDPARLQNVMLVAIKSAAMPKFYSRNAEWNGYLRHIWYRDVPRDLPPLTDGLAPVESYMEPVMARIAGNGRPNAMRAQLEALGRRIRGRSPSSSR